MQMLLPWLRGERSPDSPAMRLLLAFLSALGRLLALYQRWRVRRYQRGVKHAYRAPCPVISVGNITVGGTGKTPMVIWLARRLQQSGNRVAVVSRGYRQKSPARVTVVADHDQVRLAPPEAADEAVLLARLLPGVAVLTGSDRAALIRHATERLGSDWILMDDAFHRLDIQRDLDLVLLDARRPFGNGALLPGGILRESPEALARCDALILTRAEPSEAVCDTERVLNLRFPGKPIVTAIHRPVCWVAVDDSGACVPLEALTGPVMAFCGLAAPEEFRRTLEALSQQVVGFHAFPDHHGFSAADLTGLTVMAHRRGAEVLVCTEKDAVKLDGLPVEMPILALRVEMAFLKNGAWLASRLDAVRRQEV
ncbi:MAG: tetraacyldisaccharide 4'-kinase [Magnetococcales bacterium]|nr:tetraacyldisaccharide 4'-kinase [Magnetococcales bacterium]